MSTRRWSQVALIAAREMEVGLRSKQFYISMVISLFLIVAIVLVPQMVSGGNTATSVAVEGTPDQVATYTAMAGDVPGVAFVGAAENADVVIDLRPSPPSIVGNKSSHLAVAAQLVPYVQLLAEREAAAANALQIATDSPKVGFLEDDSGQGARVVLAYVLSILLFLQIAGLGGSVAQGTLEEKGNGVVDVLLPKVPPTRLLIGKVAGIGLFGMLQMVLLGVVGVLTVQWAGAESLRSGILPAVLVSLAWFVFGYLFVAFLSGAVASTVTRPDQLPTVLLPLQLLNGAVFVTAVLSLQSPTADWVRVLSLVPPFSSILMPIRAAAGGVDAAGVLTAVAFSLVAISLCVVIGGRVYRRSVVGKAMRQTVAHTGGR